MEKKEMYLINGGDILSSNVGLRREGNMLEKEEGRGHNWWDNGSLIPLLDFLGKKAPKY